MADPSASPAGRPVDAQAQQVAQARMSRGGQAPFLHGEIARRMAQRLGYIKRSPGRIVDWGARLGASEELLRHAYPRARLQRVEFASALRVTTLPQRWSPRRWLAGAPPAGALPEGTADLLWSNMALHFADDLETLLARWRNALAGDGFLMFSTLGPGSLGALREAYRAEGWGPPFAPFVDMHDLGDAIVRAGFADPVMDQETITLTWPDGAAALAELRELGGNVAVDRHAGLRTPRWRNRLVEALEARRDVAGRVALDFEVVYGHAFGPPPGVPARATTSIPIDRMRALVRSRRGGQEP